jgi:hypothetical protein
MRTRVVLASLLVGTLAVMSTGASAAPKTLDGKKVKKLTMVASGGLQDHDETNATEALDAPDRADCAAPRCAKLKFVWKPAKGVKNSNVMFSISWGTPLSDYDLYVAEVNKDGSTTTLGSNSCGGTGTTSEKVYVTKDQFKAGRTYALVVDFYRSFNDTVTATVEMGVPNSIKQTVPPQYDGQFPGTLFKINCTQ